MQSSAMVALRTMIMLTCLVAVPLAAVVGSALPKVVQSALDGRETSWPSDGKAVQETAPAVVDASASPAHEPDATASPPVASVQTGPVHAEEGGTELPRLPVAHITGVRPVGEGSPAVAAEQGPAEPEIETAPLWNAPTRTASTPRDRDMTAHFAPSPLPHRVAPARLQRSEPRTEALQKTAYSQPDEDESRPQGEQPEAVTNDGRLVPVERTVSDNALADSERRLRRLGATYYRLETWGDDGQFYRCSCSIACAPRGRAARHFEAIEAAPTQAIEAVIKQVAVWRASRATR